MSLPVPDRRSLAWWLAIVALGSTTAWAAASNGGPAEIEIKARRDAVSRHIAHDDGTVTAHIYGRPIHRLDDQGRWIPIGDRDLEQTVETFEYILATGHCAYDGADYGKNDMGLIKVEREVTLYPASAVERVGWMRFDLSSIPDWASITWVQCHFIVTYFEMSMGLAFTCLEADPVPTDAAPLFDAIYAGEVCAMGSMPRAVAHWDLGSIAADHLQRALARDWVAFGQVGYDYSNIISKRGWIIGWNASPRQHAPHLTVTYQDPFATPTRPPDPPTATPTPSCTPAWTATPVPTGTATAPVWIELDMPDQHLTAGERFRLERRWGNPTGSLQAVDELIILDVWGRYWFHPDWTPAIDWTPRSLPPGTQDRLVVLELTWPPDAGQADGIRFWAALLDPAPPNQLICHDMVEWGYE